MRKLIADLGMSPSISVEPQIAGADKIQFLQNSDGYILPSRWECHGLALLENLALGVPCIVSDTIHIAPTLQRSRAALLSHPSEADLARPFRCFAIRLRTSPGEGGSRRRDIQLEAAAPAVSSQPRSAGAVMTSRDVTVAISTSNRAASLERCVSALLDADVLPAELVIVDESTDAERSALSRPPHGELRCRWSTSGSRSWGWLRRATLQ